MKISFYSVIFQKKIHSRTPRSCKTNNLLLFILSVARPVLFVINTKLEQCTYPRKSGKF